MTIKDIARLANVSVATVSKVINGKAESISSETKAKIFAIIKRENYVPYKKVIDRANRNKAINSVLSLEHVKMMLFYRNHPFSLTDRILAKWYTNVT